MTQDTAPTLPKYFKDALGYCYIATPALAAQAGMTPWDGAVDAKGFATEAPAQAAKPEPKPAVRNRAKPAE